MDAPAGLIDAMSGKREQLEERLGYRFANTELLERALTHSSAIPELRASHPADADPSTIPQDNENLEFLGDAVLDLCVSEILLDRLPDADEGILSRAYGSLVNADSLARWARENDLGAALQMGKGAASTGVGERTNVLADTVEALLAAIYLDGGLAAARRVAGLIVDSGLTNLAELARRDAKTTLQELVQSGGGPAPSYRLVAVEGPDHDREFLTAVELSGTVLAEGRGRTKKLAEQAAATAALDRLEKGELTLPPSEGSPP